MNKNLSPKGIEIVENLISAMEEFTKTMGIVSRDGKANDILYLVDVCSSQINDVMEA